MKNKKALTAREIGATRNHKEATFGHLSLVPFVNLVGECAPPVVFAKGASRLKAWQDIWPGATVIATENGSITSAWFVQVMGIFGKHVREELQIDKSLPILLLLDSGGGGQLHISAECSLVAESFGIRTFFFRKYMTPAVCSLDQRPNREAEKKFHDLRCSGFDMSPLGALHAAREVSLLDDFHSISFAAMVLPDHV